MTGPALTAQERVLYHQVVPLKVAGDVGSTIVAIPLLWNGELWLGLAIALGIPVLASAVVLRSVSLEPIARGPIGAYLRTYMTPPLQALRLGLAVLGGAWWHSTWVIAGSILGVSLAWTYGLVKR